MECEFSVEMGADDPTLAVPWQSPDGSVGYVDLRAHPTEIERLSEVRKFPELGEFLRAFNRGSFATAKCDAWFDSLMDVDDEPYGAAMKCASYVDVFLVENRLASFHVHENLVREIVRRVRGVEDAAARAEIVIRRAWFGEEEGMYWTVYATGYGKDPSSAREQWSRALEAIAASV